MLALLAVCDLKFVEALVLGEATGFPAWCARPLVAEGDWFALAGTWLPLPFQVAVGSHGRPKVEVGAVLPEIMDAGVAG